mmetsp:Transcript_27749/g.46968  ORF Transcript_27749/g.46968 Transcript_27749/m.46968 type:complete len:814 (-) Transcript_27749:153-2594(-)
MGTVFDDIEPLTGKLSITCVRASDVPKKQLMGKQDPYCVLEFGKQKKKTKVHKDGDRHPQWNQTLEFDLKGCDDRHIQVKIMNENFGLDGECCMVRIPIFSLLSEPETWIPLYKEESHRRESGKILFKTQFEGSGGLPPAPNPSRYGIISAMYGTDKIRTDVRGLLEKKVAGFSLKFESSKDLSSYFGFDPLSNHISGKELNLTYMKGGKAVATVIGEKHKDTIIQLEDLSNKAAEAKEALLKQREREAKARAEQLEAELKAAKEAQIREKESIEELFIRREQEMKLKLEAQIAAAKAREQELLEKLGGSGQDNEDSDDDDDDDDIDDDLKEFTQQDDSDTKETDEQLRKKLDEEKRSREKAEAKAKEVDQTLQDVKSKKIKITEKDISSTPQGEFANLDGTKIALLTHHNTYISARRNLSVRQMGQAKAWEIFTVEIKEAKVAFRSHHGTYLSARKDNSVKLEPHCKAWEMFDPVFQGQKLGLRSAHKTFICAMNDNIGFCCNPHCKGWELYSIVPHGPLQALGFESGDKVSLRDMHNSIMSVDSDGVISQVVKEGDSSSVFTVEISRGKVALKSSQGTYLVARKNRTIGVNKKCSPNALFTPISKWGKIGFKTIHESYLCSLMDGKGYTTQPHCRGWELFLVTEIEEEDDETKVEKESKKFFQLIGNKDKYHGICKLNGEKGERMEIHITSKTHKNIRCNKKKADALGGFGRATKWAMFYLGNNEVKFLHLNKEKYLKVNAKKDRVTINGKGGKACHFRIHNKRKNPGQLVALESVKVPGKFLRVDDDGSIISGDDKGPASKYRVLRAKSD